MFEHHPVFSLHLDRAIFYDIVWNYIDLDCAVAEGKVGNYSPPGIAVMLVEDEIPGLNR